MLKKKKAPSLILMEPVYARILELQQSMRADNHSEFEIEKATRLIVEDAFRQLKAKGSVTLPKLEFANK